MINHIDTVYDDVRASMLAELSSARWQIYRDERGGPFGSRYVEMHRQQKAVRFVWDAKEAWFLLEECRDLADETPPKWKDIHLERIKVSEFDAEGASDLVALFRNALSQFAADDRAA